MYDPPTFYLKNPFSVVKREEKILKFRPFEKTYLHKEFRKIKDAKFSVQK